MPLGTALNSLKLLLQNLDENKTTKHVLDLPPSKTVTFNKYRLTLNCSYEKNNNSSGYFLRRKMFIDSCPSGNFGYGCRSVCSSNSGTFYTYNVQRFYFP